MRRITTALIFLAFLLSLGNTSIASAAQKPSKPVIYTVNYPLEYFAGRIAGDLVQIVFPAPANVDPAFWVPDEATLVKYQQADLILLNGANYAHWLTTVSLPDRKSVV